MKPLNSAQLITELSKIVDPALADAVVTSYVEMQQRFLAGDWQPTELDGRRLCEAVARAVYQMDSGTVTHSQLPGVLCEKIEDDPPQPQRQHNLRQPDRVHICKAIGLIYKFRSSRGSVHISPHYKADFMDSMLIVHAGKWLFAEFLRLAWKKDKEIVAATIAQIVQLEYSLVHELDGVPLVLDESVSAPVEILLLLNHADGNRLQRDVLRAQAKNNTPQAVDTAISRLTRTNEIRATTTPGELALTPKGQKRVIEKIIPSLKV
jgi:hypothetical protein